MARTAAHRGSLDEALDWLGTKTIAGELAKSQLLAARCDIVSDFGLWDRAESTVSESRRFVELAIVEPLRFHADRLEGRAAFARGELALARDALTRSRRGFAALESRWEEAISALWLAEALRAGGAVVEARSAAEAALAVFAELRSVRELEHARGLLVGLSG